MGDFFAVMTWPLVLCLALGAVSTFLGERMLERRTVFLDLALAQVAGLGAVWGVMLGWSIDTSPWVIRSFAAGFVAVVAAGFTGLQGRDESVSKEALGGGLYALAAGGTLLISTSLHHGAQEVRDLLTGKLLFVRPRNILGGAALFAAVGAFVHRFRARMAPAVTRNKKGTRATVSEPSQGWMFAFYAAVGLTVSYAVGLVGVLLVFAYLLLPAATGALLSRGKATLRYGWLATLTGTTLGLAWAYAADLPPEPAVTVSLGVQLVAAAVTRHLASGRDRIGGLVAVLASVAFVAMLLAWTFQLRAREETFDPAEVTAPSGTQTALVDRLEREPQLWSQQRARVVGMLAGNDPTVRSRLLRMIAARADASLLDEVHTLLSDDDDLVRDSALQCVRTLALPASVPALVAAAEQETDEYLRADLGVALLELGSPKGLLPLLEVMELGRTEYARRAAFEGLRKHRPGVDDDAYDSAADEPGRAAAVQALRAGLALD